MAGLRKLDSRENQPNERQVRVGTSFDPLAILFVNCSRGRQLLGSGVLQVIRSET